LAALYSWGIRGVAHILKCKKKKETRKKKKEKIIEAILGHVVCGGEECWPRYIHRQLVALLILRNPNRKNKEETNIEQGLLW